MENFFEFFDLPVRIELDEKELKRKFLKKSREYHPDMVGSDDAAALEKAERMSAFTNEVYKTLSNKQERISYILLLNGLVGAPGQNQMSPEFLMEVMELNEAIMELQFEENETAKKDVLDRIRQFKSEIEQDAQAHFAAFDAGDHSQPILEGIRDYFLKHRYLLRMEENMARSERL